MKMLRDILSRRKELIWGIIEFHPKKGNVTRSFINEIGLTGEEVNITTQEVFVWNGKGWTHDEKIGEQNVKFDASLTITGGERPQFDFKGGWVIIYPNTDSVRIA